MLILDLSPLQLAQLEQESQQAGMTLNNYAVAKLFPTPAPQKTILDLVQGKHLEGFNGDPVAIQQALRDD